jgi:HK97 family phage prohead protease
MSDVSKKILNAEVMVKNAGRRFLSVITTDSLDRDGEVLIPDGMDSTEFERTGTVFWNHNYDMPIGKLVGKLRRNDDSVEAETEFAVRPDDYQGEFFPDFARAMVEQGVVRGVSVGFIALDMRRAGTRDIERYGESCKRVINRWKLLEYSIAPVQCNPDALIASVNKGKCTKDDAIKYFGIDPTTEPAKPKRVVQIII